MEIGSEYSIEKYPGQASDIRLPEMLRLGTDHCLTWLGRTAIDLVLADIMLQRSVRSVYMPSYCCESMVAPFREKGIKVSFYSVNYCDGLRTTPDYKMDCDIFFSMNYFGAPQEEMEPVLAAFRAKGAVVIEDITHSIFSAVKSHRNVDYTVASLRKWIESPAGGIAVKYNGDFLVRTDCAPQEAMVSLRLQAMLEKDDYLKGKPMDKSVFLDKYARFNRSLENDYHRKQMDPFTMGILGDYDFLDMIAKRRANAELLYEGLGGREEIKFLVSPQPGDCPLFVPVLVAGNRDALHRALVENQIFCPKHWPVPQQALSNIYAQEISLICDQRYGAADMERIIACIRNNLQ